MLTIIPSAHASDARRVPGVFLFGRFHMKVDVAFAFVHFGMLDGMMTRDRGMNKT